MDNDVRVPYLIQEPELRARGQEAVAVAPIRLIPATDLDGLQNVAEALETKALLAAQSVDDFVRVHKEHHNKGRGVPARKRRSSGRHSA